MSSHHIRVYGLPDLIDPFNLKLQDLNVVSIAHSLALSNRYTGHTVYPFSVAQHSFNLVEVVPSELKRAAMMHDWVEFVLADVSNPVKGALPEYRSVEHQVQERIFELMGESISNLEEVSYYDCRICHDEMDALFPLRTPTHEGFGITIEQWPWQKAKVVFLNTIRRYL